MQIKISSQNLNVELKETQADINLEFSNIIQKKNTKEKFRA